MYWLVSLPVESYNHNIDNVPTTRKRRRKCFSLSSIISPFKFENVEYYKPPPPIAGKKTVVLDMDETLIHCSEYEPSEEIKSFKMDGYFVYKRPGLDKFLKHTRSKFEIFIFTYGEEEYANPILDVICPFVDQEHRLFRDSCEKHSGKVKKDLKMLGRDKKNLIFVDDNQSASEFSPKNTLKIERWEGYPYDRALIDWLPQILSRCFEADDVRDVIKEVKKEQKKASFKVT